MSKAGGAEFDEFWIGLLGSLCVNQHLTTWSTTGNAHGVPFCIVEVGSDAIVVGGTAGSGITKPRSIPRRDFELVFSKWQSYCDGDIARKYFASDEGVKHLSYVLGIVHWHKHLSKSALA